MRRSIEAAWLATCVLVLFSESIAAQDLPTGRACHSALATRAGMVIWGGAGFCGGSVVADSSMWLWNGASWRALQGPPVPPREDALLLAGAEPSLILIGGRRAGQVLQDVWQFDGRNWEQLSDTGGPGAIQHGAGAYDPVRRRVVVFGGAVGREMGGKTYEWDGSRWHVLDVPGPAPRVGHSMAWSEADGGVLLYGGFAAEQFRDLWKWDGTRWQRLSENGPSHTEGHVLAAADSIVYLIGPGVEGSATVGVWGWKDGEFAPQGEPGPPLMVGATATYDARRRVLIYWGGSDPAGRPATVVHEFDGTRWRSRTGR